MNLPIWAQAARLAAETPPERNRYIDFLRAASICGVILGHWLEVSLYTENGTVVFDTALVLSPGARWLTWLFQVMPIFFLAGGYVDGLSWQSAQRRQEGYASWLARRLRRLMAPVLPLLAAWTLIGATLTGFNGLGGLRFHSPASMLEITSQYAMLPAWLLAFYILLVLLAPLSFQAWQRYKFASFWALVAAAALVDLLTLGAGWRVLGGLNYLFVWLAVHQLGFAWQSGRIGGPRRSLLWAGGGLAALVALVVLGPYPVSMVSVRGEEISNILPPRLPFLALGVAQCGLLLAVERPARRLLERGALWTSTVLIDGILMTIFLWHHTALLLVSHLALYTGVGLSFVPGAAAWWLTRPLWFAVLVVALVPFVAVFTRFERMGLALNRAAPPLRQLLPGCALVCSGLAILTLRGIPTETWPGINFLALGLPFIGAALVWFTPRRAHALGD